MIASIGGAIALVALIASGVAWELTEQTKLDEVAGAVQQLQQSREIDLVWNLQRKWATYGLTVQEHQQWCFLAKKHSLPPCPNRLKK